MAGAVDHDCAILSWCCQAEAMWNPSQPLLTITSINQDHNIGQDPGAVVLLLAYGCCSLGAAGCQSVLPKVCRVTSCLNDDGSCMCLSKLALKSCVRYPRSTY